MRTLTRRWLVSSLMLTAALGSLSAQATESKSGSVVALDRNIVYVSTSSGPVTVRISPKARIWKGKDGVDVSAIQLGDDVAIRGVADSDGTFVPSEVWVNITALDGVIARVNGNVVDVRVIRNDGADDMKRIRITPELKLRKEEIEPGLVVRAVGLALKDGTVQASRFTIYVNGRPVDSSGTKYVDSHTGRIIDKP